MNSKSYIVPKHLSQPYPNYLLNSKNYIVGVHKLHHYQNFPIHFEC